MQVDRTVALAKFARELHIVDAHLPTLVARGIWVRRRAFPYVDVAFMTSQPLRIVPPMRGEEIPILGSRPFGARFDLEDFDLCAPSVTFHDVRDWALLPPGTLAGFKEIEGEQKEVLLVHPKLKRLFLCVQGTREYHEHPDHTNDDWLAQRDPGALLRAIESVWATCVDAVVPLGIVQEGHLQFRLAPRGG